ncbi:MAG: nucleotide exchange factor GrpE [Planctomycetota bacterium]
MNPLDPSPPPPRDASRDADSPGDTPPSPESSSLRERLRAHWIAQIDAKLDEALAEDPPPEGIDPAWLEELNERAETDLYTFTSALTALTQEIKLQGRSFQKLEESLSRDRSTAETQIAEELHALRELLAERDGETSASLTSERKTIDLLLDLHERLARGLESATRVSAFAKSQLESSFLLRRFGRRALESILDGERELTRGVGMTLSRVDEALRDLGVTEIACLGQAFDPRLMRIVQVQEPTGEESTGASRIVVEVFRKGYRWRGDVLRFAEVLVSGTA